MSYPQGILWGAYCSEHCEVTTDDVLKGDLAKRCGAEETSKGTPELCNTHDFHVTIRPCSLCNERQATTRHWTDECPVIHAACKIVGSPGFRNAFEPAHGKIEFVRTVCMLHQVRLLLLCRAGNVSFEPRRGVSGRSPMQALNQLLEAYLKYAHPSCLTPNIVKAATEGYRPQESRKVNSGCFKAPSRGGGPFVQAGRILLDATQHFEPGALLYTEESLSDSIPRLGAQTVALPETTEGPNPNVHWRQDVEENRYNIFSLKAVTAISPKDIIVIKQANTYVPSVKYLLARFDGSCKWRDKTPHCGAGTAEQASSSK